MVVDTTKKRYDKQNPIKIKMRNGSRDMTQYYKNCIQRKSHFETTQSGARYQALL